MLIMTEMYRFSRTLEWLHGLAFISVQHFTQTVPKIWRVRLEDRTYSYPKRSQKLNNVSKHTHTHTHTHIHIYISMSLFYA
jgi:hypothetical protein